MPEASQYGQIDFRTQVIMVTPPLLRSVSIIDWHHSLVYPLDTLMDADWVSIYDQYIKGHLTGQKMVMQEGLNFLFKIFTAPFILVETFRNEGVTIYMFNEIEPTDTYIWNETGDSGGPTYALNEAEAQQPGSTDFIVKMPTIYATADNLDRLMQQVDIIKLTGRTYRIITY